MASSKRQILSSRIESLFYFYIGPISSFGLKILRIEPVDKIKMMMFSMSLRFYSPKIQSALSISAINDSLAGCSSYILSSDATKYCTLDGLTHTGNPDVISSDLVLRNGSKMVILVGNPEQNNYKDLIESLVQSEYGFAIRWHLGDDSMTHPWMLIKRP